MKRGKALKKGDTIGLIAPAGPADKEKTLMASDYIKSLGYKVVFGRGCFLRDGYLSGSDNIRAADFNEMFRNRDIKAIFCLRGGYGSSRIIPLIDDKVIRNNPKIFVGYSDITSLHLYLNKHHLITFHGPMPSVDMCGEICEFSINNLINMLEGASKEIINPPDQKFKILNPKRVSGRLVGGNLTIINSSLSTNYEIDTKDNILFIEDCGEEPYKVDRMLTQLILSGKLRGVKGIILGEFSGIDSSDYDFNINNVFMDRLYPLNIPILSNLKAGHIREMATLPLGCKITLNCENNKILVEEKVVEN